MLDILPQLILNGLIAGGFYALLAVGLALIYGVLDIQNFAHGYLGMFGAFFFYLIHVSLGWPIFPSLLGSLTGVLIMGLIEEYLIFLRIKDLNPLISLVSTVALGILLKNLALMIFGPGVYALAAHPKTFSFWNGTLTITNIQLTILGLTILLFLLLFLFLKKTKIGTAIRAVADNKEISAIIGINVRRIITVVVIIASFLAGAAGIMAGYDQNVSAFMGTFLSVKAFAAVILGGLGSIPGAALGGFIIGIAENMLIGIPFGNFYLPSSAKDAIAFGVLIVVLYIRPFGIFGMSREEAYKK